MDAIMKPETFKKNPTLERIQYVRDQQKKKDEEKTKKRKEWI